MSRGGDRHRLGAVPRRRQPHLLTSRIAYLPPAPDAAWARPVLYDAFCTPCLVSAVVRWP